MNDRALHEQDEERAAVRARLLVPCVDCGHIRDDHGQLEPGGPHVPCLVSTCTCVAFEEFVPA